MYRVFKKQSAQQNIYLFFLKKKTRFWCITADALVVNI